MTAPLPFPTPTAPGPFAALGLYGLESLETVVLAGLITGDPVLLIGPHGTAKTALCERLAQALGLRFRAYDASKALFEDLVGFPDPTSLAEGRLRYVPSDLSIWDRQFVLVDELSRATPTLQNKWLEVVRSRRVMGAPVPGLKHVFAAMNPPGYLGARALDAALIGRFAVIARVPGVDEMPPRVVEAIVRAVSNDDAPACHEPFLGHQEAPDSGPLHAALAAGREELPAVLAEESAALTTYVRIFGDLLRPAGLALSGRRLALMYRTLAACRALDRAQGRTDDSGDRLLEHVSHLLPHEALEIVVAPTALFAAHQRAHEAAWARLDRVPGQPRVHVATRLLSLVDPVALVDALPDVLQDLSEEDHHEVVSRVLRPLKANGQPPDRPALRAALALRKLASLVCERGADLPLDASSRVLVAWQALTGQRSGTWEDLGDLLRQTEPSPEPPRTDPDWLATRLALEWTRSEPGEPTQPVDAGRAVPLLETFRRALNPGVSQ